MTWRSIPPLLQQSLCRHPALLAKAVAAVNRLRRLATRPNRARATLTTVSFAVALVLLVTYVSRLSGIPLAVRWLLEHRGLVGAVSGLYIASMISRHSRDLEAAVRQSWLIATSGVRHGPRATVVALISMSLLWRLVIAAAAAGIAALNAAVTVGQALHLMGSIVAGAAVGTPAGWWLSRQPVRVRYESSRYVPRFRPAPTGPFPSTSALSRWPIVQALAWSRPENARLVLLAAILSIPGGTGVLGAVCILGMWFLLSYLFAVLRAVPHVARLGAEWLRSTPIGFWAFARPIAGRALLHQFCGTLIATTVLVAMGSPPATALSSGALWLTLAVLTTAVALVDCYRGRAWPLRRGAMHERP